MLDQIIKNNIRFFLAALFTTGLAWGKVSAEQQIENLLDADSILWQLDLKHADFAKLKSAMLKLNESPVASTQLGDKLILKLEKSPAAGSRAHAAWALGVIRYNKAVATLLKALKYDRHYWVRKAAALALADTKLPEVIQAITEASQKDKNAEVRKVASSIRKTWKIDE